jgi:plastocyanin
LLKPFLTFVHLHENLPSAAKRLKRVGGEAEIPDLSARSTTIVGVVVAVLIIGAVASIGYYQFEVAPFQTTATSTTTAASCTPTTCVNVQIYAGAATTSPGFTPDSVTVVIGTNNTVVWLNNDTQGIPHTVTPKTCTPTPSCTQGWPATSGSATLNLGDTYQWTFTVAGTYTYDCSIHPAVMTGTVIVKA